MKLFDNHLIAALRHTDPAKKLITEGARSITAGELLKASIQRAALFRNKGMKKGDKVLIAVPSGIDLAITLFALMMNGVVIALVDPQMGRENYKQKLRQLNPDHAVLDSRLMLIREHPLLRWVLTRFFPKIPVLPFLPAPSIFTTGIRLPVFTRHVHLKADTLTDLNPEWETIPADEDFFITYTSGTTSEPKGVVHSYRSLSHSIGLLTQMLRSNVGHRTLATHLPHYLLIGINAGLEVHIWKEAWSPSVKLNFIEDRQISTLFGPPSEFEPMIRELKQNQSRIPSCVAGIFLGSAPVPLSFLEKILPLAGHADLTILYGMTEHLLIAQGDARKKFSRKAKGDWIGKPFADVELSFSDEGELGISSAQIFKRYWGQDTVTLPFPTGDLARLDEEGNLVLLGRKKDMIIRGNFNIYPPLYEPIICSIPGIWDAALVGRYNEEKSDEELILVVESDGKMKAGDIMVRLRSGPHSIDREALPDQIIFMPLPRCGRHQKIDKKLLVQKLLQMP